MTLMHPLFADYVERLEYVKRRDPKTVERNGRALRRLSAELGSSIDVEGEVLSRYFVNLTKTHAESTVQTEVTVCRAAYRWLASVDKIPSVPVFEFEAQNGNCEEPHTFSNDELRTIKSFVMDSFEDTLFHLLAYTGMRRAEIAGLTWSDVNLDEKVLSVLGKGTRGGKLRRVPAHPVLVETLRHRRQKRPNDWLVLGVSTRTVNQRLSALLKRSGVDGGNRPAHAFRKTVASVLAEEGVNPTDIDKIMGWSPPTVRERYYTRTSPNLYGAILKLYASDPIERSVRG